MLTRGFIKLLFLFTGVVCLSPAWGVTTSWTLSLNNSNNTFTASESVNTVSVSGTITRPSTGFVRMVVTASSGALAPAINEVRYLIEVPGLATIAQPMLVGETDLIYLVEAGTCPSATQNSIWIFGHWDRYGSNDMTSASQPAFGTATYTPGSPSSFTLNQIYEVNGGAPISGFSSFSLNGTCSSGQVPITGAGDRGGTVYVTANGGTFFRTNGNKGVLAIPQVRLTYGQNELTGNYSGFRYTSTSSPDIRPMRMSVTTLGWAASGNALTDPNDGTTDPAFAETLSISSMNDPVNGMIRGTITRGAQSGMVSCAAMMTTRNILFCAGQSPDSNATPFNLVLVSDAFRFTKGVGAGGYDVKDIVYDSSTGKTYVGGDFTTYRGAASAYLVRLNTDGSLDTSFNVGQGLDSAVFSITLATDGSGDVYAGGAFDTYDGVSSAKIIRFNSDGTRDTSFNTTSGFFGGYVYRLAVATDGSNKLYAGGYFTSYGGGDGTHSRKVARLNTDGTLDTTFATNNGFGTGYDWVQAILPLSDGDVYLGGQFSSFNGTSNINNIVRLNSNGSRDTGFNIGSGSTAGADDDVNDIVADGTGDIYVGGWFSSYRGTGTNAKRIMRLNSDGSLDTAFATGTGIEGYNYAPSPYVNKIVIVPSGSPGTSSGDIMAFGEFAMANGVEVDRWARFNTDGSLDTQLQRASVGHWTLAGAAIGNTGNFWVGGRIRGLGNLSVHNLIKINYLGALAAGFTDIGPNGFDEQVEWSGLAPANDGSTDIYVSGEFDQYNTSLARRLARLNENGTLDFSFDFSENSWSYGPNGNISVVAAPDGSKVYAFGNIEQLIQSSGTHNLYYIARLHKTGLLDTSFATGSGFGGMTNSVLPMADGDVYVGGNFETYSSCTAKGIVRLNSDGSCDSAFDTTTGFNSGASVKHIATAADGSNKLYVAGEFTSYKGTSSNRIVRLNTDASIDASFVVGTGFDAETWRVLPLSNGKVYVAGYFYNYDGTSMPMVLRLNANGGVDATFDTNVDYGFNDGVQALALANDGSGDLYVGGGFTAYRGVTTNRIARLNSDGTVDATFNPGTGFNARVKSIISRPSDTSGQIYVGGQFTAYDGYPAAYIARLKANGQSD